MRRVSPSDLFSVSIDNAYKCNSKKSDDKSYDKVDQNSNGLAHSIKVMHEKDPEADGYTVYCSDILKEQA